MSKTKPPAFQFYVRDYMTDETVMMMDLAQEGAYIRLLCHQWLEGSIPNDIAALARLCRVSSTKMKKIWQKVSPCFTDSGNGRLVNSKLDEQRQDIEGWRKKQSDAGRSGAQKRWSGDIGPPLGPPMANHTPTKMGVPILYDSSASASATASAPSSSKQQAAAPAPDDVENSVTDVIRAANKGMISNPNLPETTPPILAGHGRSRQQAFDWINAGIPVATIVSVVEARARMFRPDKPGDRIHSLAYFDAAVREAHETGRSSAWKPPAGSEASRITNELPQDRTTPRVEGMVRMDGEQLDAERRRKTEAEMAELAKFEQDNPEIAETVLSEVDAQLAVDVEFRKAKETVKRTMATAIYRTKLRQAMERKKGAA